MGMCTHMHARIAPNTHKKLRGLPREGPGSKSWPEIVEQLTQLLGQPILSAEIQVEGDGDVAASGRMLFPSWVQNFECQPGAGRALQLGPGNAVD